MARDLFEGKEKLSEIMHLFGEIKLSEVMEYYSGKEKQELEKLYEQIGDSVVSKDFIDGYLTKTSSCDTSKTSTKIYRHFVEAPKMVKLKDIIERYSGASEKRLQRLYSILGDVIISQEFIDGYLAYFSHLSARREDLLFTEESLHGMYELSMEYPQLESESIKLIMGEYVKDMFDKVKPLKYFDGMTLDEMDDSFELFMVYLKKMGSVSDIPYKEQESIIEIAFDEYGSRFVELMKKYAVTYHKSLEELFYSVPTSEVVRKDADVFYEVGSKELFGPTGYPYSYKMCKSMILFDEVDDYQGELMYSSSIRGKFESPMTREEFIKSVEEKRKRKEKRKK